MRPIPGIAVLPDTSIAHRQPQYQASSVRLALVILLVATCNTFRYQEDGLANSFRAYGYHIHSFVRC